MAERWEDDPAPRLRIHQAIARQIGTEILSGELRPGDALSGEIEQSLAMGVSRTPYREAIRILVSKGLLESRPKAGTYVTPKERWNLLDLDVLAWMFAGKPDPLFIRDLFELRRMPYEFGEHVAQAKRMGFTAEEIETIIVGLRLRPGTITRGRSWRQWQNSMPMRWLGDATWSQLAARFDDHQMFELLVRIGQFTAKTSEFAGYSDAEGSFEATAAFPKAQQHA